MLRNQKGQAIIELAVLGSLVIMAFSIVIGLSESYNRRQSYMQQTFRATLYKAKAANESGGVSAMDFRRMPNVTNPMEVGAFQSFSSGNNLIWADGRDYAKEAKQYFLHGRSYYDPIPVTYSGVAPDSVSTSVSSYNATLDSHSRYDKNEHANNIGTTKSLGATGSASGKATVGSIDVTTGGSLSSGGLYYGDEGDEFLRNTTNTRKWYE
ncbi:MAG: hypothetical protein COV73_02555 [Candidatus Omnitrophica bacterium CG11_big_fil_rev_8_21_14_0_20_43_6]|nr:MAG: hypothetical protein COV73_02555 [Candidatus Omnitrophica bacterium CG11_big_fil_rev_8_21_14_0_20_43_6]